MIAVGYARLSKDHEKSVSIEYQTEEIKQCAARAGYDLLGIEIDNDISGATIEKRPSVRRVLAMVESRAVDAVIVYKSDRMSRDGIETLQIEKLFLKRGVAYLSCTEGNLTSDSVDEEFMRFIRAGLNQRERKVVSLRTKAALKHIKEKGQRYSNVAPFGYRVEGKALVIDMQERMAAQLAKECVGSGMTLRQTSAALAEKGYLNRNGRKYSKPAIHHMVKGGK